MCTSIHTSLPCITEFLVGTTAGIDRNVLTSLKQWTCKHIFLNIHLKRSYALADSLSIDGMP
jgi:hypothetical protein